MSSIKVKVEVTLECENALGLSLDLHAINSQTAKIADFIEAMKSSKSVTLCKKGVYKTSSTS